MSLQTTQSWVKEHIYLCTHNFIKVSFSALAVGTYLVAVAVRASGSKKHVFRKQIYRIGRDFQSFTGNFFQKGCFCMVGKYPLL